MQFFRATLTFCLVFFAAAHPVSAQDEPETIRIRKESNLVKAVFDNTELKLMAIDRFGNPKENRIVSYKLWIKGKSDTEAFPGYSNALSADMIRALKKHSKAVKIFFTDINVQDEGGHLVKLPDVIDTWFPECSNCEKGSRGGRRR